MKYGNRKVAAGPVGTSMVAACVACGRRVMAQLRQVRGRIFAESRAAFQLNAERLHLVLNEAEALAAQTEYPHLFFPVLAAEKVQALAEWDTRQQAVRRRAPDFARLRDLSR